MKTFTPYVGFETTEAGQKVRYEKGRSYELDDGLADSYADRGLGDAVGPRFLNESFGEDEEEGI